jgi:hypothetical protein
VVSKSFFFPFNVIHPLSLLPFYLCPLPSEGPEVMMSFRFILIFLHLYFLYGLCAFAFEKGTLAGLTHLNLREGGDFW